MQYGALGLHAAGSVQRRCCTCMARPIVGIRQKNRCSAKSNVPNNYSSAQLLLKVRKKVSRKSKLFRKEKGNRTGKNCIRLVQKYLDKSATPINRVHFSCTQRIMVSFTSWERSGFIWSRPVLEKWDFFVSWDYAWRDFLKAVQS